MVPKSVLAAAGGGFLALTIAVHSLAAPPTEAPGATPERQLTFAQSDIRLSLGALVLGEQPGVMTVMTVTVQNDGPAPIRFAALSTRTISIGSQAVLSDDSGNACTAEGNPAGIAQIPHISQTPRPVIPNMTTIPPRSRMNAVFRFIGCRLSGATLSFAGEFALSTDGRDVELVTVPFWGIVPKTATR